MRSPNPARAHPRAGGRLWAAAAILSLLTLLAAAAVRADHAQPGLAATYEALIGPARTIARLDDDLSGAHIAQTWDGHAPDAFAVTWRGFLYVPEDGAYTLATRSDGESTVFLDGRIVLENGSDQPDLAIRATVRPDSGPHAVAIVYRHNGGSVHFELLWAHGDESLRPIPAWVLRTERTAWPRILIARWLPEWLPALACVALLFVLTAAIVTMRRRRHGA